MITFSESQQKIVDALETVNNATNGDVMQMMFPKLEYKYTVIDEYTNKPTYVQIIDGDMILTNFSTDWWNAPYRKGGNK